MKNNLDNFLKLNVVEVRQLQNGIIFTGKIKFNQLNKIFKLTERKENITDPFDNTVINLTQNDEQFQRQLSSKKLKEIQEYLKEEIAQIEKNKSLGMFPSSVILYNRAYELDDLKLDDLENNEIKLNEKDEVILTESIISNSYSENLDCCFYLPNNENGDLYTLYIPNNPNTTLIVDGQHRFFGTKLLYNSLKDENIKKIVGEFEYIITYLVGFDIYEVGQIFATVNFNQKPVNRSLYYDIFGSAPQTDREGNLQNEIRLAHDLALHLNNSETSPANGMIKLLGKGYGLFSQAFFVSNMLKVFKTGIWNKFLIDYINSGNEFRNIAKFMKSYFQALHEAYPSSWAEKVDKNGNLVYSAYYYPYVLCKTTGLGAYFRLIKYIFPLIGEDTEKFKEEILNIFKNISDDEAKELFSKSGPYGGAGSEGLQDKLFRHLYSRYDLENLKKDNEISVILKPNNAEARTQ
jgi:DGQHR domain-containing protein